jgi:protoporphyrinogen oxidase
MPRGRFRSPKGSPGGEALVHRRDVLRALLGAPLAATACDWLPRRRFDGELRGPSVSLGHRLRGPERGAGEGPVRRVGVAIVGAGPAGLSAAWRLERLGFTDYVVLELEDRPGGTSAYGTDGVVPHPWGGHYVPAPSSDNPGLVALLDEVGAIDTSGSEPEGREGILVREPEERLFVDGRWHRGLYPLARATPSERAELGRFEAEVARLAASRDAEGRAPFTIPLARCSDDATFTALDRESAAAWLERQGYRSPSLRWYVDYACRDDYGLELEQTSAWAMLFYFASRLKRSGRGSAPLLTWPEGNGRLIQHLADQVGERLELGRLVKGVTVGADGVELMMLDAGRQEPSRILADQVVLAVPRFIAARLAPPGMLASGHEAFTYGSWIVSNVHLSGRPGSPGFPFAWDNVLYESPSLGYVVATHQTLRDLGPTVWTYYQPLVDDEPSALRTKLLELSHQDYCDALMSDLARAHRRLEPLVERIDVWRWGHAMVRPVPGFIWSAARRDAARPRAPLYFAHSDLSGLALFEESQYHGVRAAEDILVARGRPVPRLYGG